MSKPNDNYKKIKTKKTSHGNGTVINLFYFFPSYLKTTNDLYKTRLTKLDYSEFNGKLYNKKKNRTFIDSDEMAT